MPVALVLGTRPEIIKLAPVVRALQARGVAFRIYHTGQHYSDELDAIFFRELNVPEPHTNLGVGSREAGAQTGQMAVALAEAFARERPSCVVVQGDTNSTLAGALAAAKGGIPLVHVEAGLRSGDRSMPEEINRILADHAADLLLAPTGGARDNLLREGLAAAGILVTGNTVADAVVQHLPPPNASGKHAPPPYALATLHRAGNADDRRRLQAILEGFRHVAGAAGLRILLPLHPRTRSRAEAFGLDFSGIDVREPIGYPAFLGALAGARLALTDSGGVQEEACILGVPCVTVRDQTERPETVAIGANRLARADSKSIQDAANQALAAPRGWRHPYGDGHAAERIVEALIRRRYTQPTIVAPVVGGTA